VTSCYLLFERVSLSTLIELQRVWIGMMSLNVIQSASSLAVQRLYCVLSERLDAFIKYKPQAIYSTLSTKPMAASDLLTSTA